MTSTEQSTSYSVADTRSILQPSDNDLANQRREKRLAYMRQYWLDNKEKLRANQQRWRDANRDKVRATNRAYYQTMREGRRLLLSLPASPPTPTA